MERLIICETDRGRYAVRPMSWAGIWNEKGQIKEALNHLALFIEKKDAEKFVEWKEAEEQGRLLRLPCAVGDTVYSLDRFCGGYSLDCLSRPCESCEDYQLEVYEGKFKLNDINDFEKTVFLTRPDAVRALAEMEGKK